MPKHCLDENGAVIKEKLHKYIVEYLEHEQVQLDAEKKTPTIPDNEPS